MIIVQCRIRPISGLADQVDCLTNSINTLLIDSYIIWRHQALIIASLLSTVISTDHQVMAHLAAMEVQTLSS